jgi:ribosomal-protein-alanine N-acetyltransferase
MRKEEAGLFARWEAEERPYPWNEKHFLISLTSEVEKVWVWEEKNQPAGFVSIQRIKDEAYMLNLMVRPSMRRQGIARRLIEAVQKQLKADGAHELWLDVEEGNAPARNLYEKAGFELCEKRPGAYPRGETAVSYRNKL